MARKNELSIPDKHRKRIALQTLKMPDALLGVMGGMSKSDAVRFLKDVCSYSDAEILKLIA